jgi:hypothetical protein
VVGLEGTQEVALGAMEVVVMGEVGPAGLVVVVAWDGTEETVTVGLVG